eukprot:PhM_4_TR2447/c2_g1_i4/m.12568
MSSWFRWRQCFRFICLFWLLCYALDIDLESWVSTSNGHVATETRDTIQPIQKRHSGLSVVVKTEQTNETKTNNNFTHNPRIHTTQRPTNNARQINFTGDAILIVGDSIARYLFMGMRARAETLGYVGDDSKVPSHPPLDSYRRGWELYAHVATAYLRHPTRNTSLHLRYERVQYLDELYDWSSSSSSS